MGEFEKGDPGKRSLDLDDEKTWGAKPAACMGKWVWILCELQRKYDDEFFRKYVAALRKSDTIKLVSAHHKQVDGKLVRLTMDDIVHQFSIASGEDLRPWFRELGISSE